MTGSSPKAMLDSVIRPKVNLWNLAYVELLCCEACIQKRFNCGLCLFHLCPSCSKELNQWEALTEYGQSKGHTNPYLVLECAWRVSNWAAMKEALVQVNSAPQLSITIYSILFDYRMGTLPKNYTPIISIKRSV